MPASSRRLTSFKTWAKGATLEALAYVLRRSPAELGDIEVPAVEAAIERTPRERGGLRSALIARLSRASPERARRIAGGSAAPAASAPAGSAFRVGLVLAGDEASAPDADAMQLGFRTGFVSRRSRERPPVDIVRLSCGAAEPAEVASAFDSAGRAAALVCGGLEGVPALVLAAGSRWGGAPVLIAGSGDAAMRRLSPRAYWIGPTGPQRGLSLASAVNPGAGDRVAVLHSAASDTSFVGSFVEACRTRGARIVLEAEYAPGNAGFSAEIRSLVGQRATLLFWDGDPTEAAALLTQLTRERVSIRLCGGQGLAPERHHRETRVLLEGVTYVPEDWALAPEAEGKLDRSAADSGVGSTPAYVRGYLAGRLAAAALESDALTPDEVAAGLERLAPGTGEETRTLEARSEGGELPVLTVAGGKTERVQ